MTRLFRLMNMARIFTTLLLFVLPLFSRAQLQTALDSSFAGNGILKPDSLPVAGGGSRIALQPDGKILTAIAYLENLNTAGPLLYFVSLRRFLPDGRPDSTFNDSGRVKLPIPQYATTAGLAVQADGKVVVLASTGYFQGNAALLARYTATGHPDTSFNHTGSRQISHPTSGVNQHMTSFFDMAIDTGGKIWIGGRYDNPATDIHRYLPNGMPDSSFGYLGELHTQLTSLEDFGISSIAMQPDGRMLMTGTSAERNSGQKTYYTVARYITDGLMDNTFHYGDGYITHSFPGQYTCNANSSSIMPNGKIVIAGLVTYHYDGANYCTLLQLNTDGSIDSTWGSNGIIVVDSIAGNSYVYPFIKSQPDGKLLISFGSISSNGKLQYSLYRMLANGSRDAGFGKTGQVSTSLGTLSSRANHLALQQDGKILLSGYCTDSSGWGRLGVVRYKPNIKLDVPKIPRNDLSALLYPNPLSTGGILSYTLSGAAKLSVTVNSIDGKLRAVLLQEGKQAKGVYQLPILIPERWPAGIYLLHMQAEGYANVTIRFSKL